MQVRILPRDQRVAGEVRSGLGQRKPEGVN